MGAHQLIDDRHVLARQLVARIRDAAAGRSRHAARLASDGPEECARVRVDHQAAMRVPANERLGHYGVGVQSFS
jgi:hypothetical protein